MAQFLLHGQVDSANLAYSLLRKSGEVRTADGSERVTDFALLVFDGPSTSPEFLGARVERIREALENNVPVLLLDPLPEHKQALRPLLHITLDVRSVAMLIAPQLTSGGKRIYRTSEQFAPLSGTLTRTEFWVNREGKFETEEPVVFPADESPSRPLTTADVADFVAEVVDTIRQLQAGEVKVFDSGGPITAPPADVPAGLFLMTQHGINIPMTASAPTQDGILPPFGNPSATGNITFGVFFDDETFGTPAQWFTIQSSGLFKTNGLVQNSSSLLGWTLGQMQIEGGLGPSPGDFTFVSSMPQNTTNEATYTAEDSFGVELSAGTDGINAGINYTISGGQTQTIQDWDVIQNTENAWTFKQAVPFDGEQGPTSAQIVNGLAPLMGSLSTASMPWDTMSVFNLQTPSTNPAYPITYNFSFILWFVAVVPGKLAQGLSFQFAASQPQPFTVDFGAVIATTT